MRQLSWGRGACYTKSAVEEQQSRVTTGRQDRDWGVASGQSGSGAVSQIGIRQNDGSDIAEGRGVSLQNAGRFEMLWTAFLPVRHCDSVWRLPGSEARDGSSQVSPEVEGGRVHQIHQRSPRLL